MHITPLLPTDAFEELPLVELGGLGSTVPVAYTTLQKWMLPYADAIHVFWWTCLIASMALVILRYMIMPLATGKKIYAAPHQTAPSNAKGLEGRYMRFFGLHELDDVVVRLFGGAILLGFIATFTKWQGNPMTTVQAIESFSTSCWPFFQSCEKLIMFDRFPFGYSQMIVYMVFFGLIVLAAYALFMRRDAIAHLSMLLLFTGKIYFMVLMFTGTGNYDYYHNAFCIIFLFLPHKRFFASLSVAMFYVLSTVAKIHPGWTFGLYFTSLLEGMPIFPKVIAPLMTNLVIFMEMLGAWFLFSRRRLLQRTAFAFFVVFHIYSGTLVGYHYPTIVMPTLLICFGPLFKPFGGAPLNRASIAGWIFMATLWAAQLVQVVIPGDAKLTLEGNFYGLYMFEANHQCHVQMTDDKGQMLRQLNAVRARHRCDPFPFLLSAQKQYCKAKQKPKISFMMIHSINGGPFYEIVNEKDMCALSYKPFSRNPWIKTPPEAKTIGRPFQNYYY